MSGTEHRDMPNRRLPHADHVPHLHAILSLYEMSDTQLLARRSALVGELLRSLTPEERAWLLDVINVVYLASYRDGVRPRPAADGPALHLPVVTSS